MNTTLVGLIGIGKIGLPVATKLIEQGFTVIGYRRHMSEDFPSVGGIQAHSSREVAERCDVVLTCLPDDEALREVVAGENGIVQGTHAELIVVDIGMQSAQAKQFAYEALQQVNVPLLDCPISGTPPQVLARKAVLFASGERRRYDACLPVLQAFSDNIFYLGDFGAGLKMKCVANLLVAIHIVAAAEAMTLASKAGLDLELVTRVISPSVASSAQFVARAPLMAQGRYEPVMASVKQTVEDVLPVIHALTATCHSPTPLLDVATSCYEQATAAGLGDKDVAMLFSWLRGTSS